MKQQQIIVDGRLVHYQQIGAGKTVLFLHGWADGSKSFDDVCGALQDTFQCVSVDLPGFGKSDQPETAWDLTDYADWLGAFCDKSGIRPHAVVGHSNGGALAIHAISRNVIAPGKLILLAASGVRSGGGMRRLIIKMIAKCGKVATFWLPKHIKKRLQIRLYGTVGSDMLVAPHMQETFKRTVRHDIQVDASKLHLPTLLLYGDHDKATPVDQIGKRLHQLIAGSELFILKDSGHFVHHDAKTDTIQHIKEFLA